MEGNARQEPARTPYRFYFALPITGAAPRPSSPLQDEDSLVNCRDILKIANHTSCVSLLIIFCTILLLDNIILDRMLYPYLESEILIREEIETNRSYCCIPFNWTSQHPIKFDPFRTENVPINMCVHPPGITIQFNWSLVHDNSS